MSLIAYTNLFTVVFFTVFRQYSCGCEHAYMTLCESISDYKDEYDGTWSHVIIESPDSKPTEKFDFLDFNRLTNLIIIGQINEILSVSHCSHTSDMKFLSLYENKLRVLTKYSFSDQLRLEKLVLVDNQIEKVEAETFAFLQAEILDLSNNLLDVILSNTFTNINSKNVTKVISIRHNEISNIEPNSFPISLKILKLDNNDLKFLQDGAVDTLINLQELSMSHNQFSSFPTIKELRNLVTLDLSHNHISMIKPDMFENLQNLKILDLSNNRITRAYFLKPLLLTNFQDLQISLAFNRLKNLDFGTNTDDNFTEHKTFILYGNPWWCHMWISIQKYISDNNLKQTECDLTHFNSGKSPFCLSFQGKPNYFPNGTAAPVTYVVHGGDAFQATEEEIDNFLSVIKKNIDTVKCKLIVKRNTSALFADKELCNANTTIVTASKL